MAIKRASFARGVSQEKDQHTDQQYNAANIAKNRKITKYGAISAANNLEFQPLVFETTGRIENGSLKFMKKNHLITHMSRGDPRSMLCI